MAYPDDDQCAQAPAAAYHARDFLTYLAAQLHAPAPFHVSAPVARFLMGRTVMEQTVSVRYRTDKIKKMIGWTPRYPTYREGFAEILPRLGAQAWEGQA